MQHFWIIGCGDIGQRVAKKISILYQNTPYKISALVRQKSSQETCRQLGLETLRYDLGTVDTLAAAEQKLSEEQFCESQIFYFAPPPKNGDEDTRLMNFLQQVGHSPRRIVLISTTGVYGDCQGAWVDENTPLNPQTGRAKRRFSAEKQLQEWAEQYNREYIILRVPGIYSQNRLPLARLKKKLPVVQQSEAAFTNRIHADDLAEICIAAMRSSLNAEIFNACDGQPSTMVEYFNQVADFAGLERPEQISLEEAKQTLSEGMLSYAMESRRIKNDKLLNLLNIKLQYPSLSSALK